MGGNLLSTGSKVNLGAGGFLGTVTSGSTCLYAGVKAKFKRHDGPGL